MFSYMGENYFHWNIGNTIGQLIHYSQQQNMISKLSNLSEGEEFPTHISDLRLKANLIL